MGSYSVTCHPAEVTFPPFRQPKLVLDLATKFSVHFLCKYHMTSGLVDDVIFSHNGPYGAGDAMFLAATFP